MLRIRKGSVLPDVTTHDSAISLLSVTAPAAPADQIIREFNDPLLELIRLLREATEIEHALLVQYLYAAFSVKPEYVGLIGFGFPNADDLLGVAVQEMQHLDVVNRLLAALGASPNLIRQDFPYEPDIYPFEFNLEPLSRRTLAKYVYTEAPAGALDPTDPANSGELEFLSQLFAVLGDLRPNHLGSLYHTLLGVIAELMAAPPPGLPDLNPWVARLKRVREEGEDKHFPFFCRMFMGDPKIFNDRSGVWQLPVTDPNYPALPLSVNPSAFEGHPQQIPDADNRRLAWLGNLHYWIILSLLDIAYRTDNARVMGLSKAHMTGPLLELGKLLAARHVGLPFDPLSMGYNLGRDTRASLRLTHALVKEADGFTQQLRALLPEGFPLSQTQETLDALQTLIGG
jgi:hypothetical protein